MTKTGDYNLRFTAVQEIDDHTIHQNRLQPLYPMVDDKKQVKKETLVPNAFYEIDIRHSDDTRETLIARYLGKDSLNQDEFQIGINRKTSKVLMVRRKIGWLERFLKSNIAKLIGLFKP